MRFVPFAAVVAFLAFSGAPGSQAQVAPSAAPSALPSAAPANPDATPEARELLKRIDAISGHYTLTGQHNFPNHQSRWSDRIYDLTGKLPGIFGSDFGFSGGEDKDSVLGRPGMIEEAKRQYRNGAVIALCWHEVRPTDDEPVTFRDSVQGRLTGFEWSELLTPGTRLYNRWAEQVDVVAGYLKQLQDAGVPVLFRPYHEMNGNWFWWGGRPGEHGSAALYRQLFDRFVHLHHLNNLVWVWNSDRPSPNAGAIADFYPGARYVDVVTIDIYGEYLQSYYDTMLAIAGDKPIALGEVGAMPTLEVLAKQPRWAYFMMWSGMEQANTFEQLQAVFHAPNMLNRGDPPFAAVALPEAPSIAPVCPNPSAQAKALLGRLRAADGGTLLSGQQNDAASPTASSEQVFAEAGKHPAIYAIETGTSGTGAEDDRAVLDAAVGEAKEGSLVHLTWKPKNPADDGRAAPVLGAPPQGVREAERPLTDFEWSELLTAGSELNRRWAAQADELGALLRRLDEKGVAVLLTPYPEPNGKQFWWSGRPGAQGSAALYRMLFERLVEKQHVRNAVWGWAALPGGYGPQANGAPLDYFPGLLYVDALSIAINRAGAQMRAAAMLRGLAGDRPIGVTIAGGVPGASVLSPESGLSWFELAPLPAQPDDANASALKALYDNARTVSR